MRTKNIILGMVAVVMAAALTGCYEKYGDPDLPAVHDDDWFASNGYTIVPVETVRALFSDPAHDLVNHLKPEGDPDRVIKGTSPTNTTTYGRYYLIAEDYVIKGKVISNDAYGNFYNGIFILDEAGDGIEVKVGLNGLYSKYPVGETVYVICKGLALGNYRSVLSLGITPKSEDHSDSNEPYANRYMGLPLIVNRYVKRGEETQLAPADTVVVKAGTSISESEFASLVGKLVRFEGLVSKWGGDYPSFLYKYEFNTYENFNFLAAMDAWKAYRDGGSVGEPPKGIQRPQYTMPEPRNNYLDDPQPTWGFQEVGGLDQSNFGSALFTLDGYSGNHEILVRTSGYSRFALEPVTPDGVTADITGVVARYTDKNGRYPAYQITVNNVSDIRERE